MRQGASWGTTRLYGDGVFATLNGKAKFVIPADSLTCETTSQERPVHLLSGRLRDQWHGMSRTGNVAQLMNHGGEARVELAPMQMADRGLFEGDLVRLKGLRGEVVLPAYASPQLRAQDAFVAMHWGRNALSSDGVNALMPKTFDPFSKQPELKHAAIALEAARLPWQLVMMRTERDEKEASRLARWRAEEVKHLLCELDFASITVAGRERPTLILRGAHRDQISPELIASLDAIFGMRAGEVMRYTDSARGIEKSALMVDEFLTGVRLSGEIRAAPWLRELIVEQLPAATLRRWIFSSLAKAPSGLAARGAIICNCFNVSATQIDSAVSTGVDLAGLQAALSCGTSCGSCLPELRQRLHQHRQSVADLI
jgi:assimilatory nitrate reductase catalytic subunit